MLLFIDQGNSSLKWCLCNDNILMPASSGQLADLEKFLKSENTQIETVLIASVKQEQHTKLIVDVLMDIGISAPIKIAQSQKRYLQLQNGYQLPEQLGIDRWLVMVALWNQLKTGFIVVDAGSALTLDIVEQSGQHLGGHIIPGLAMQKNSLLVDTERVRFKKQFHIKANMPGKSTSEAVHYGCLTNLCSYITSMYKQYSVDDTLPLVITGGDALTLSKELDVEHQIVPDLVLQGLYYSYYPD